MLANTKQASGAEAWEQLLAKHFALERAIDSVWRRARQSTEAAISLGDMIDAVLAKCPGADRADIRREFEGRFKRSRRPRRPRATYTKSLKF
jgi:hypothetical protein